MKQYCIEFELSSCNKKICCRYCDDMQCVERCGVNQYKDEQCGSLTDKEPVGFDEMFTEVDVEVYETN